MNCTSYLLCYVNESHSLGLKLGAKDYLTKPIEIGKLISTLQKHLVEK